MATKSILISAKPRAELGSRANKKLRDAGLLPGVVYGHKEAVVPVTLPRKELVTHLNHGVHVFDLAVDGKAEKVLVKEVQYDHLGNEVLHVDFARVSLDEKVEVTVPLEFKGTPKGEADGGVLQTLMTDLEVECLVTDIPESIRVNVADLAVDDVIHIKDLQLPAGVRALKDEDVIVATVTVIAETTEPEQVTGESAEPELIGRKPAEEGGDEAPQKE